MSDTSTAPLGPAPPAAVAHDADGLRSLVTPEGVDLGLGLATMGQRFGAFALDLAIMVGVLIGFTFLALGAGAAAGGAGAAFAAEMVGAIWMVGSFLIRTFYFIFFEAGPRAATWGKRAVGLRVVARSGERLTSESVVARNLMRELEIFLPLTYLFYALFDEEAGSGWLALGGAGWVLIFLLFPLFNKDRLRVGDLLAGTWVVTIPKRRLAWDLIAHAPDEQLRFTPEQLDAYGVFELQTLEQVLRDGQPETMAVVADTIRQKIGYWGAGDTYEFLSAYYAASRRHMERGLLFGKRRAHKYDR
jgi:uncharacterized RDD family membrane protein YckC